MMFLCCKQSYSELGKFQVDFPSPNLNAVQCLHLKKHRSPEKDRISMLRLFIFAHKIYLWQLFYQISTFELKSSELWYKSKLIKLLKHLVTNVYCALSKVWLDFHCDKVTVFCTILFKSPVCTHPHTHTHIFTHSFTPRCNLESPIHITAFRGSGNKCTISRNTDDRKDIAYATWLEKRKYGHNHRILFFFPLACMFLRIHSICCVFNAWVDLECVSCELVFYSKCNI